ncbi:VanZ family protein [Patescibacteria group bacterium]|nr:VanZ family protein [Patescibacteria group bacterium]
MNQKLKNWTLVFLWAGVVFFFSSQPSLKSNLPNQWDFILRKLAHLTEYAVLTFLLIRALKEYRLSHRQVLLSAITLALLYAISDEYHQTFVFGRQGAPQDVLIDGLGILLMAWRKIKR